MAAFSHRYVFRGRLKLLTALHIGGGRGTLVPTESPVVRTPDGRPFIPGSSFKGAFRATVEKLASALSGVSCGQLPDSGCVGAQGDGQKAFNKRRRNESWDEARLVSELAAPGVLCHTCKLFGSSFLAGKIQFDDLYLADELDAIMQIRDGVAIDRDSEKAVDGLKYDYEVVPANYGFDLTIRLNEPDAMELALACVGVSEFAAGFGQIGGLRSRGLGRCQLGDLRIYELDLRGADRAERLKRYLLGARLEDKMTEVPAPSQFLESAIDRVLSPALAKE